MLMMSRAVQESIAIVDDAGTCLITVQLIDRDRVVLLYGEQARELTDCIDCGTADLLLDEKVQIGSAEVTLIDFRGTTKCGSASSRRKRLLCIDWKFGRH